MTEAVQTLLGFGAVGLVAVTLAEKLIPIIPSHALLIMLGMTVVDDQRSLLIALVAATVGSTLGSLCWYTAGRMLGAKRCESLVSRFGKYAFLTLSRYRRMTHAYRQRPFRVTLLGQLLPTVRLYLPLPAGVISQPLFNFILALALGSLVWNFLFLTIGYALGDRYTDPARVGLAMLLALIAVEASLAWVLWVRRQRHLSGECLTTATPMSNEIE